MPPYGFEMPLKIVSKAKPSASASSFGSAPTVAFNAKSSSNCSAVFSKVLS